MNEAFYFTSRSLGEVAQKYSPTLSQRRSNEQRPSQFSIPSITMQPPLYRASWTQAYLWQAIQDIAQCDMLSSLPHLSSSITRHELSQLAGK